MSRYARRVDREQPVIVKELRALGFSVIHVHQVGRDAPDIIVGKLGITVLVEIKTPGREKREKERLANQAAARAAWTGDSYIQATTTGEIVAEFQRLHAARRGIRPLV